MGAFKKYKPYYACNALRFTADNHKITKVYDTGLVSKETRHPISRVPNFKDIFGNEYYWLYNMNTYYLWYYYINMNTDSQLINTIVEYPSEEAKVPTEYTNITDDDVLSSLVNPNNVQAIMDNYQTFINLVPIPTNDLLADYDIEDYSRDNQVGKTLNFERSLSVSEGINSIKYQIIIINSEEETYVSNSDSEWKEDYFYEAVYSTDEEESRYILYYELLTEKPAYWDTDYDHYFYKQEASNIEVSCIKFFTVLAASKYNSSSYSSPMANDNNADKLYGAICLLCAYFLDEPITLAPGEMASVDITFRSNDF